jgi:hypothetical protein
MDEMPRFRFSLRSLTAGVAVVAAYCAAMVSASPLVSSAAFLITVFLLLLSILGAIESKPLERAFLARIRPFWLVLLDPDV